MWLINKMLIEYDLRSKVGSKDDVSRANPSLEQAKELRGNQG